MIPSVRTPEDHRFLALCMLLMYDHPRIGASMLAIHRSEIRPFSKGWNVIYGQPGKTRTCWIYIDDCFGYTKWSQPDIEPEKICEVDYALPLLNESTAWNWVMRLYRRHSSKEWARDVINSIHYVSDQFDDPYDPNSEFMAVDRSLMQLKQRLSSFNNSASIADYLYTQLIDPYLHFAQPGFLAAPILVAVLAYMVNKFSESDQVQAHFELRDILGDRLITLINLRKGRSPGGFAKITYLAALYGKAALLYSNYIRFLVDITVKQEELLSKWDQNVDEQLAHEIFPVFTCFSMSPIELFLPHGEKKCKKLNNECGSIRNPDFDFNEKKFKDFGPCSVEFLQNTAKRIQFLST